MLVDYETLVALLEKSDLPDQGLPARTGVNIRFQELKTPIILESAEFKTPDGRAVVLALNATGDVCAIAITKRID
jgi:hypothetical protein